MSAEGSRPTHEIRVLYDLKATMRDGVTLSADVFLPRCGGAFPTLLLRTPYESLHEPHIDWAAWWAKRGYAVVIQDCRGRFESEGVFQPYRDDGPDGHDTLEWIAGQSWCNGKIGTSGRSYGGLFQWQLAPYRSRHLTAMAPQVIMGDYFKDCHRVGGAVQWTLTGFASVIFTTSVSLIQRGATHIFGNSDYYRHLPLMTLDEATIGRVVPWYRDWCEHVFYDDYWRAINTEDKLDQIDVPIRQQAAWYDPYTAPALRAWNGMRTHGFSQHTRENQSVYVIPWTHHLPDGSKLGDLDFGPSGAVDLKDDDLRWFDYWLKGLDTGITSEPPIKLFVMGENRWRFEHEWPLARTQFTRYHLHSNGHANSLYGDGTLSLDPPGGEPPDRFEYDPAQPVPTLGGNNSTWTWMKFAQEPIYPGPIDQRPLVPGEVAEYRIELAPTSNVFLAGHRIRVEISSSNFPRFDRNLNNGEDIFRGTRMQTAHQTVLHSTQYPSHILLPIVPR